MTEQALPLTDDDWPILTNLLVKLANTQPWRPETYEALARCVVNPAIETVIWRRGPAHGELQFFLAHRPTKEEQPSEPFPEMLAGLGTIFRKTDARETDPRIAFARLEERELKPARFKYPPELAALRLVNDPARGVFLCCIHLAEIKGTPAKGKFYPAQPLPDNLVPSHRDIILPTAFKVLEEK